MSETGIATQNWHQGISRYQWLVLLTGWIQRPADKNGLGYSLEQAASLLSWLFLLGVVVVFFAKETRGEELPE